MTRTIVKIRMYKGLLGDCFLILIDHDRKKTRIMIDCGVLQGTEAGSDKMLAIAEDIARTCGATATKPGTLDLLVVTHEHWDHISGFAQARAVFLDPKRLKIEKLWYGWTEDPEDDQASRLRARFGKRTSALAKVAERAKTEGAAVSGQVQPLAMGSVFALENLENFMAIDRSAIEPPGGRMNGAAILDALRGVAGETFYLEPGQSVPVPGGSEIVAHVLGPPRDETLLFKDLPAKGRSGQSHFSQVAFNEDLLLGLDAGDQFDADAIAGSSPFSKRYRSTELSSDKIAETGDDPACTDPEAATRRWLRRRYFDERPACRYPGHEGDHECEHDLVCGSRQDNRRIDGDWLGVAGALALKLDSDTNNTSLVLAFELPDRTFLLFAADAQVGNWESWAKQHYDSRTIDNILAATRFYKVGHHGSHNATLLEYLKKMTSRKLAAMIPTDEAFAMQQGRRGWKMPDPTVRNPLIEQAEGRVLFGDREWGKLPASVGGGPDPNFAAWKPDEGFAEKIEQTPLYVEYRVYG